MAQAIFKNSSILVLAQFVTKLGSFFYTLFLISRLDPENFGIYILALSYFSLVSALSDFGISRFLIREISSKDSELGSLVSTATLIRLAITSVAFALFAVFSFLFDPDKLRSTVAILAVLAAIPQSVSFTLDALFLSRLKISFSAIGLVVLNLATILAGVLFVSFGYGSLGAVIGLMAGQLLYALFLLFLTLASRIDILGNVNINHCLKLVKGSLPYAILTVLGLIYFKIDSVLLGFIKGNTEVAIYGAAYKFLEAILFIPAAVSTSIFPVLSRLITDDRTGAYRIYLKATKALFLLSIPVTLGFIFILPLIIKTFLPSTYLSSIKALQILSLSLPFFFINSPQSIILSSSAKFLPTLIKASLGVIAFNIILNLVFIPKQGYIAASWVTLASEVLISVIFYQIIKQEFRG